MRVTLKSDTGYGAKLVDVLAEGLELRVKSVIGRLGKKVVLESEKGGGSGRRQEGPHTLGLWTFCGGDGIQRPRILPTQRKAT